MNKLEKSIRHCLVWYRNDLKKGLFSLASRTPFERGYADYDDAQGIVTDIRLYRDGEFMTVDDIGFHPGRVEITDCVYDYLSGEFCTSGKDTPWDGLVKAICETVKKEENMTENRRELVEMPYDRDGMHCTGYEVFVDGQWWNEYLDEETGEVYFLR